MKSLDDSLAYCNNPNSGLSRINSKVKVDKRKETKLRIKRLRITFQKGEQVNQYNYLVDSKGEIDRD